MTGAPGPPDAVPAAIAQDLQEQLRSRDAGWSVESVGRLPEGHSGFSYVVAAKLAGEPRELVLRLPPPGARAAGPADVARQGRIAEALHRAGFPVPPLVAMSADPVVDGRPFTAFLRVAGDRVEVAQRRLDPEVLTRSAVATARRLHAIPLAALPPLGEPVPPAAEVGKWHRLQEMARTDLGLPYEPLRAALLASLPPAGPPCLVHSDFHFGNLLFDPEGQVVAVLDWEIAEIGQRLLDPACLAVSDLSRGREEIGPIPGPPASVARLRELYGADPTEFDWYCAATCYKYAAVYVYNLMLHRRGKRVDPFNDRVEPLIERLLVRGLALLGG